MAFEQKDGSGALFRNEERESEQQPHYRGSITVGGVEYYLSAWIKESKKGTKYMSLSAQPKGDRPQAPRRRDPEPVDSDLDDRIPF